MNNMSIWDWVIPISCSVMVVKGVLLLMNGCRLAGLIVLPIGVVLLSIRLGYSYYKDKQDEKINKSI